MGQILPTYFSEITNQNQNKIFISNPRASEIRFFLISDKTFNKLIIEKDFRGLLINLIKYKILMIKLFI